MKLYVMRHGPGRRSGHAAGSTPIARSRPRVAAGSRLSPQPLTQLGEEPLFIVTSPLVRAVQTAEIVALATKLGDRDGTVDVRRGIAPGGDGAALAHALVAEGRKRVMLVGHEPNLSGLVSALVGGFGRPFDKAMVVGVHLPSVAGRGRLRFVLEPKTLKLSPDARTGP